MTAVIPRGILLALTGAVVASAALAPAAGPDIGPAAAQAPVCTIPGTPGDDELVGTTAADVICGEGGNDILRGLDGADRLIGGDGNDVLQPGLADDTQIDGGPGEDTIRYSDIASGGATIDLAAGTASGPTVGSDAFTGIERVVGTNQTDTIHGTVDGDWLTGLGGIDTLHGLAGNDVLMPGAATDTVNGDEGIDVVRYNDLISGGVTIELVAGTAVGTTVGVGSAGSDTLNSIERAYGSREDDRLTGTAGNDALWGFGGADVLIGLAGDDQLLPGTGDDPDVAGGEGVDMVNYSDTYGADAAVIDLLAKATSGPIGIDVLSDIEDVAGTRQDDVLNGDDGANTMYGLDGDDTINGLDGDDVLDGGTNDTTVPGDQCDGGGGTNTVTNCEGTDPFSFVIARSSAPSSRPGVRPFDGMIVA